jgi:hypothetical protein
MSTTKSIVLATWKVIDTAGHRQNQHGKVALVVMGALGSGKL